MNVDKGLSVLFQLSLPVMVFLLLGYLLPKAIGAARCNWTAVRRDWRRPLITASADEIARSRARWPYRRSYRWPTPISPDGRRLLSVQLCEAYARTSQEIERTRRYQAEVLLVLGAAIIGVQIPDFLTAITEYHISAPPLDARNWMWAPIAPFSPIASGAMVLVAGFMLRWSAEKLKLVHGYYLSAAVPDPEPQQITEARSNSLVRMVRHLLRGEAGKRK